VKRRQKNTIRGGGREWINRDLSIGNKSIRNLDKMREKKRKEIEFYSNEKP
jgi:hypothetical protein